MYRGHSDQSLNQSLNPLQKSRARMSLWRMTTILQLQKLKAQMSLWRMTTIMIRVTIAGDHP